MASMHHTDIVNSILCLFLIYLCIYFYLCVCTCAGSVSSISEAGKRLHITVIGYIDDKEVNRLEKEYITDGNTLIETFSVSTKEI